MFKNLVKMAREMGFSARESETFAGQYFDGEEHGEYFPVAVIEANYENYNTLPRLEKLFSRRGLVYEWRPVYGGRLYTVWNANDKERANALENVARAFLEAFWNYRHANGPDNVTGMIQAGRAAIAKMEV